MGPQGRALLARFFPVVLAATRKAARATGENLASRALLCGPVHSCCGRMVASAMIPPAHRPAASRWAASAVILIPHQGGDAPAACPEAASATTASATAGQTHRRRLRQT